MSTAVRRRARDRDGARRRIQRLIASRAPALHAGARDAGLDQETLAEIVQELFHQNRKRGAVGIRRALRLLDAELRRLQRTTQGDVALPDIPVTIQRQRSPFTPDRAAAVRAVGQLEQLFSQSLVEQPNVEAEVAAARILLSAILYGGLVHASLLSALPEAINSQLHALDGLCWCDLQLDPGTDNARVRRWFPDPITTCLIVKWRQAGQKWPRTSPRSLVWELVRTLSQRGGMAPMGLARLVSATQTRLRIDLPGVLVDFLASTVAGQSLPARTWWHILCDYHLKRDKAAEDTGGSSPADVKTLQTPAGQVYPRSDHGALRDLLHCLRVPGSQAMRKPAAAIRSLQATRAQIQCRPLVHSLFEWAIWMLRGGTGYRFRPSSVARYLNAFGKPLVAAGGELNFDAEQVEEHLEALYETVLESTHSVNQRTMAVIGLRHFHHFLRHVFDVPAVAIDDELSSAARVNANTISDREFERIQAALLSSPELTDERHRQMLAVIALLFYRLGLRRTELAWLRLSDVQYQADAQIHRPILWIHAHPSATLKTYSSRRRLPLAHLMTEAELRQFGDWLRRRARELGDLRTTGSLIFCDRGKDTERLPDAYLDLIVDTARKVCGDPQLVLHSFRHAFASHLFAAVMHAGWLGNFPQQNPPGANHTLPWRSDPTDTTILKRHFFADTLPRGAVYLISTHAGHVDPTETTRTYVHHQDYFAYLYLRERVADKPNRFWASMEGISEAALKVRHSRSRAHHKVPIAPHLDTSARLLMKIKLPRPPGRRAKPQVAKTARLKERQDPQDGLSLDAAYRALSLSKTKLPERVREYRTGTDIAFLRRMWEAARVLANAHTRTRDKTARRRKHLIDHARTQWPALTKRPQLDRLAPALPRRRAELALARMVFSRAVSSQDERMLSILIDLLARTSRSDRGLSFTDVDSLISAVDHLHELGIRLNQMKVLVRSIPRSARSVSAWRAQLDRSLKRRVAVELPSAKTTPAGRRSSPDGRMSLKVSLNDRASSGWRVGCFYAACVISARSRLDIAA